MLSVVAGATSHGGVSTAQILAIAGGTVVAAFVISLVTVIATKGRALFHNVEQTTIAVVGRPGTTFHPEPIPGLAQVVPEQGRSIVNQGNLLLQQGRVLEQHGVVLESLVRKANLVIDKTEALVKDSETNDGSSSRDAINRIEAAVTPHADAPEVRTTPRSFD